MRQTFWVRPAAILVTFCFISAPLRAQSGDSMRIAMSLGNVIAAEEFCGLDYDQQAIADFIAKNVRPNDMDFANNLQMMTDGLRYEQQTMSASSKTAHCAQISRVARSYGFTH